MTSLTASQPHSLTASQPHEAAGWGGDGVARGARCLARRRSGRARQQAVRGGDVEAAAIAERGSSRLDISGACWVGGIALAAPQHAPRNGGRQQQQSARPSCSDASDGCCCQLAIAALRLWSAVISCGARRAQRWWRRGAWWQRERGPCRWRRRSWW